MWRPRRRLADRRSSPGSAPRAPGWHWRLPVLRKNTGETPVPPNDHWTGIWPAAADNSACSTMAISKPPAPATPDCKRSAKCDSPVRESPGWPATAGCSCSPRTWAGNGASRPPPSPRRGRLVRLRRDGRARPEVLAGGDAGEPRAAHARRRPNMDRFSHAHSTAAGRAELRRRRARLGGRGVGTILATRRRRADVADATGRRRTGGHVGLFCREATCLGKSSPARPATKAI